MSDMHLLGIAELLDGYRRRAFSPVEVTRAVLGHIERCEARLHATYALDAEAALAQARASEARWQRNSALALDGVPCTLKENIATRGTPVPLGCAATELLPAADDAPPAARLREAGAVIVCKTTMPDLGMLSSGLSSFHPLTRNPWNIALNPGGSSAGAAAAAAAGYGPLHLGTDIGGSIRLPAGWCGLVGLKPSLGRIPIQPPYAGRVAGPMTRTVVDAVRAMPVLCRPDWRDAMSLPWQAIDWYSLTGAGAAERTVRGLRGARVGLQMDAGWGLGVEPAVRAVVEAAARAFEAAGAVVEPMAPFMTRAMIDGLDLFWRVRAWQDLARYSPERRARVLPYIRAWAEGGAAADGAAVFHGHSQMAAMRDAAVAACRPYALVLSPVSPMPAFAAERASPIDDPERPFEHIAFTLPFNMSEQPSIALNAGYTAAGLPVGVQLTTARHDDLGALRAALAFEQLRGPQRPWPAAAPG